MLATCYLPRRWPAKYFHLCKSLRPCSGWERVVSLRLVTSKLFVCCHRLFSTSAYTLKIAQDKRLRKHLRLFSIISACQIKDLSVTLLTLRHYGGVAKPPLRTLLVLSFDKPTPLRRFVHLIKKSPRPISNARLKMLPLLHLHPINVIIYNGTYWLMP